MRFQGVNSDGMELTSAYVDHDPATTGSFNGEPSMTRQEFKDECDINVLMAGYEKTGQLPMNDPRTPEYFDASAIPDFREALDLVREAGDAFMRLPASVRKEFDNDVPRFVDFATDPVNLPKMREWGLAKPVEPEVAPAPVSTTPPAGS